MFSNYLGILAFLHGGRRYQGHLGVACSRQTWFGACGGYCQGQGVEHPQNRGLTTGKHHAGHRCCETGFRIRT